MIGYLETVAFALAGPAGPFFDMMNNLPKVKVVAAQKGVTLIELLVAMLMLVMVTSMLYSVLNVGIKFSRKGEGRLAALEVERSFLELLHRQVHGVWFNERGWYGDRNKKVMLTVERDMLKMVTTAPLVERSPGLVLAVYWYDAGERTLYYTEKLDFFNIDYGDNYFPADEEMVVLLRDLDDPDWQFDESEGLLTVTYRGASYEMWPRVWPPESGP